MNLNIEKNLNEKLKRWEDLGLQKSIFDDPAFQKIALSNVHYSDVNFYESVLDKNATICRGFLKSQSQIVYSFAIYTNQQKNMQQIFIDLSPNSNYVPDIKFQNYSGLSYAISNNRQFVQTEIIQKEQPLEVSYYIVDEKNRTAIAKDYIKKIQDGGLTIFEHYFIKHEESVPVIGQCRTSKDISLFELYKNRLKSDEIFFQIVAKMKNKEYDINNMTYEEIKRTVELGARIEKTRKAHRSFLQQPSASIEF